MSLLSWIPWFEVPLFILTFATIGFVVFKLLKASEDRRRILERGIPAQATILQIWETGVRVNYSPQVGIRISVMPPSGIPYETQVTMIVSQLMLPRLQPGAVVRAKLDPANPNNVVLDP